MQNQDQNQYNCSIMTKYRDKIVVLTNLQSQKGASLNGLKGNVIGHEQNNNILRLLIRLSNNDPTIYKIKIENVIFDHSQQQKQAQYIKKCMKIAQKYIKQIQSSGKKNKQDKQYRFQLFKQHFYQYKIGNYQHYLKCLDLPQIVSKGNKVLQQIKKLNPKCQSGNGKFCIKDLYLENDDDQRAEIRLKEYMIAGFCVRCQIVMYERYKSDDESEEQQIQVDQK